MGFLLLGVDSLIACAAIGMVVSKRSRLPLAAFFAICDGGGFLLGHAFHWNMPGGVATIVATAVFVGLGLYWIAMSFLSRKAAGTRWVWVLPIALSIDNITFGLIDHNWTTNVWGQAGEQVLSSALLAGAGLMISVAIARAIPEGRRGRVPMLGLAGVGLVLAAGVELLVG
jgi:putative Mn2+ efflux pump MntP